MIIETLQISDFRVLEQLRLDLGPGLNLIWGENGAGKTSVLEAVFLAGRGRSFRHQEAGPFVRTGGQAARVVVKGHDAHGRGHVLGIERGPRTQRVKFDGALVARRSDQVRALPLQLLTPNSHALIEGPPELRRRYLDLGLFHVEPRYHQWLSEYQRALRQRNAALRTQPGVAKTWDPGLEEAAACLHAARAHYVDAIGALAESALAQLAPALRVTLEYKPGWDADTGLAAQLATRFEADRRQGFTGAGPHRADIRIRAEDADAAKRLSRGQQKLVLCALLIAQAAVQQERAGSLPVLLLDDLPAELDRTHRAAVTRLLEGLGAQSLITSVDPDSLPLGPGSQMFHVEHGRRVAS